MCPAEGRGTGADEPQAARLTGAPAVWHDSPAMSAKPNRSAEAVALVDRPVRCRVPSAVPAATLCREVESRRSGGRRSKRASSQAVGCGQRGAVRDTRPMRGASARGQLCPSYRPLGHGSERRIDAALCGPLLDGSYRDTGGRSGASCARRSSHAVPGGVSVRADLGTLSPVTGAVTSAIVRQHRTGMRGEAGGDDRAYSRRACRWLAPTGGTVVPGRRGDSSLNDWQAWGSAIPPREEAALASRERSGREAVGAPLRQAPCLPVVEGTSSFWTRGVTGSRSGTRCHEQAWPVTSIEGGEVSMLPALLTRHRRGGSTPPASIIYARVDQRIDRRRPKARARGSNPLAGAISGSIAQRSERPAHNRTVPGSNPGRSILRDCRERPRCDCHRRPWVGYQGATPPASGASTVPAAPWSLELTGSRPAFSRVEEACNPAGAAEGRAEARKGTGDRSAALCLREGLAKLVRPPRLAPPHVSRKPACASLVAGHHLPGYRSIAFPLGRQDTPGAVGRKTSRRAQREQEWSQSPRPPRSSSLAISTAPLRPSDASQTSESPAVSPSVTPPFAGSGRRPIGLAGAS